MPELPEVETVRRSVEHHLCGRRVVAVGGRPVMMRRPLDPAALDAALGGAVITGARRRGKYLLVDTDAGGSLLVHLGMSGRLHLDLPHAPLPPHTHLRIAIDDGRELRLVDPRRFGFAHWLAQGEEGRDPSLSRLGLEPLDSDLAVSLPPLLRVRRAPLKALLLDQRLVAGVGNIYATEALWRAGIRPTRAGCRTAVGRLALLATALCQVLLEAIDQGGTTLRDFANPDGGPGYFSVRLQVYGRDGQPCPHCRAELRRAVVGGRSTTWCARCQR